MGRTFLDDGRIDVEFYRGTVWTLKLICLNSAVDLYIPGDIVERYKIAIDEREIALVQ
jgi:hypothetical protein